MFVNITWTRTIIIIAVIFSTGDVGASDDFSTSTESSADYLRKVMIELKDLNGPTVPVTDRPTGTFYIDVDDKNFLAGKRHSDDKKITKSTVFQTIEKKLPTVAHDQSLAGSAMHNQYYQVPAIVRPPQKVIATEAPVFTKGEIAAFYNHAMEQGSVASLNALANVLRDKQLPPSLTTNKVELTPAQSIYTYYLYPIKSFMNDMRHNVQPNMLPYVPESMQQAHARPQDTQIMQETQKEVANPLFAAISGFIGMAVLFMIGMFLLPRFGDFTSRVSNDDDYLRLTDTICGAIDRHNCTYYPDIKDSEKKSTVRKPGQITRPSSVVLLPRNPLRHKDTTKRRRKIHGNCKNLSCKKTHRVVLT